MVWGKQFYRGQTSFVYQYSTSNTALTFDNHDRHIARKWANRQIIGKLWTNFNTKVVNLQNWVQNEPFWPTNNWAVT